jgi:hypothetical protein
MRERQILEALGAGARTIPELVKVIHVDVPEKLHQAAGESAHCHLRKLRDEGRASETVIAGQPSRWTLT